jgi:hypothetical protein
MATPFWGYVVYSSPFPSLPHCGREVGPKKNFWERGPLLTSPPPLPRYARGGRGPFTILVKLVNTMFLRSIASACWFESNR